MIWLLPFFWAVCGVLTYASLLAYFQRKYKDVRSRVDAGVSALIGILGPIGLIVAIPSSNFLAYGLKFIPEDSPYQKRKREEEALELRAARKKYWSFEKRA